MQKVNPQIVDHKLDMLKLTIKKVDNYNKLY